MGEDIDLIGSRGLKGGRTSSPPPPPPPLPSFERVGDKDSSVCVFWGVADGDLGAWQCS